MVKPFPISVAFDEIRLDSDASESTYTEKSALLRELGVNTLYLGVGVDRVDYTKGIQGRFRAIGRLMEYRAKYHGKFTSVQIGAPSRSHIQPYHDLLGAAEAEANRIN